MINNKKAQNVTQPYVLILIVVMTGLITTLMFNFGADYATDPNNKLDNRSISYIFNKSGFTPTTNITSADTQDPFFTSNTDNEGNLKDFALEFQFYREQSSTIRSIIQDVWGLPTFFIDGLFLDLGIWATAFNIISILLYSWILFGIYRFLRGLIK